MKEQASNGSVPRRDLWMNEASAKSAVTRVTPQSDQHSGDLSTGMRRALNYADKAAQCDISVLITGETGVGKDVLARRIHEASTRASGPLVSLNCGALTKSLVESELFGHERGAFTGASGERPGLLEAADCGTVFLDEIGEMPLGTQVKLLTALERREVLRIGSRTPRTVNVRFLAATNRRLDMECERGRFRSDLFFRLAGLEIYVPPLRERRGELEALVRHFIVAAAVAQGRGSAPTLSPSAAQWIIEHDWPGNIRELKNVLERATLLCEENEIRLEHLGIASRSHSEAAYRCSGARRLGYVARFSAADELERARIVAALSECGWNQSRAAKILTMSRNTLITRLARYGIARPLLPRLRKM